MCEEAGRDFRCQAQPPCWPLSSGNALALAVWHDGLALGPELALALHDLACTPEELADFRQRLLACAALWPRPERVAVRMVPPQRGMNEA